MQGPHISTMPPSLMKSAMISRGMRCMVGRFSCSPVFAASFTASRLRNTATG